MIPLLPPHGPLFVPDLPGYGASAPIENNDKLSVGTVLLEALKTELSKTKILNNNKPEKPKVVIIGHDRGARVAHHLTVNGVSGVEILGVCLIDIVPTSTQWQHHASPGTASKEATGYFHWPFLANVDLATRMIRAFGPSNFCQEMILRWAGSSASGLEKLKADDALEVYGNFLAQSHTLTATCEDYREGATTDVEREQRGWEQGVRIEVPLLLLYSASGIGARFAFPDVWLEWVRGGVRVGSHALGGGVGHFGPEEAPDECADVVKAWLGTLGG
ncbi:alpha/beta-hydrolase [Decorospora gaudefroyi]|uniref:Alpha/beta-hydrolase n=1 Tax=Decorospora gaudefroyi TaxID=184978 RepID=A0A6A5K523_9PLEO|nr:alpha/beta-hydrolase [Decorospora gaudefroyi]